MADTKISGLVAVTAFATAQEFPVNDVGATHKITGTQLIAAVAQGTGQPSGGYVAVTANQGAITTEADLTSLTLTLTTVAGRRYKITGVTMPSSTIAADVIGLFITDGSSTHLQTAQCLEVAAGGGTTLTATLIHVPGAGSRVYKLRMARQAGTGTITNNASATNPSFILVEDIGV